MIITTFDLMKKTKFCQCKAYQPAPSQRKKGVNKKKKKKKKLANFLSQQDGLNHLREKPIIFGLKYRKIHLNPDKKSF